LVLCYQNTCRQAGPIDADQWCRRKTRRLRDALLATSASGGGSSQTPTRALLLSEPPNAYAGEIADKG
jgi:hypothetical protein